MRQVRDDSLRIQFILTPHSLRLPRPGDFAWENSRQFRPDASFPLRSVLFGGLRNGIVSNFHPNTPSFHQASMAHVPRGAAAFYPSSAKFFRIRRPSDWLFSGWNCVA